MIRALVALVTTITACAVAASAHAAPSRTLYVDCGVDGVRSTGGSGTATDPIRDLATLNRAELSPGTVIRFRRGSMCRGMFKPRERQSGLPGAPIRVEAYGPTALGRPLIAAGCVDPDRRRARPPVPTQLAVGGAISDDPAGLEKEVPYLARCRGDAGGAVLPAAIYLRNVEYWEIRDIEVTNDATTAAPRLGILVELENFGDGSHYLIDNVNVHHVRGLLKNDGKGSTFAPGKQSGGIQFRVTRPEADTAGRKTRFVDVTIQNSAIWSVDLIGVSLWSEWMCRPASPPCHDYRPYNANYTRSVPWSAQAGDDWYPSLRVVVRNNYLHDIGGDALIMRVSDGARIESNLVTDAWTRAPGNSAGIWAINTDNALFQYNEVRRTHHRPAIEPGDGMAFDADMGTIGTIFRDNYTTGNAGGLGLLCGCGKNENGRRAMATGTVFDRNFSLNDGRRGISASGSEATTITRNIIATLGRAGTPVLENLAESGPNALRFTGNVFVTGTPQQPIARRKNPVGGFDAIQWSNNSFIGPWAVDTDVPFTGNRRTQAVPSQRQIAAMFARWSRESGFAKRRFNPSLLGPL